MKSTYPTIDSLNARPSILEIVSSYLPLRRSGREHIGLCPFHSDKNPSFRVSEDKGVYFCFACQEGGDVLAFVMKHDGLTFPQALALLGMGDSPRPPGRSTRADFSDWVRDQIARMNDRIRDLDEGIEDADELGDDELAESLWNERRILADMRDDLAAPQYLPDFVAIKDVIEKICGSFE